MIRGVVSTPPFFTCPARALGARVAFFAPKPSSARPSPTEMTGHGPASITVTGICVPAASKTRVIPSLRPISPFMALLDLDLYIHPCGQIEFCECVHGLRPRIENVDQPLVRLELELLAALLVDVRTPQHGPELPFGGQRDRAGNLCAGFLGRAHDVDRKSTRLNSS